uniref:Uncharacterized protein n=1 Tax=Peronospora matthiolae TaxID=2874970 RepID=A0AAV1TD98_9STRA
MSDPVHPDQASPPASGSRPLGSSSTIPTSGVGTSTPTSTAIPDSSTVPVTEFDCSAAVASAQMGEDWWVFHRDLSVATLSNPRSGQDLRRPKCPNSGFE